MDLLVETVRQLTEVHAVSGYEDDMIDLMRQLLRPFVSEVKVDRLGNVAGVKPGVSATAPRIVICAHMDEVGFMVKRRNSDGSLGLSSVSGNVRALPGSEVEIRVSAGRRIPAVVGIKSAHLTSEREAAQAIPLDALYVYPADEGETSVIPIGSTVAFKPSFRRIGRNLISTKSLDDRSGCAALVEIARVLSGCSLDATVVLVGTTQEEISCEGALAPALEHRADAVIAIDGTVSYDTPDTAGLGEVRLGGGPVITRLLRTSGLTSWTPNPKLARLLETVAAGKGIPTQVDVVQGLMADVKPLRLFGIPSAVIGIPMRCKHSPAEVVSVDDLQAVVRLVCELCRAVDGAFDISRGS